MAAFLCWLGVRLMECQRVSSNAGSICLHINHTAHAWVKCMMDDIFGKRNFRNAEAWCYRGVGVPASAFARKHDSILSCSKSATYLFNRQFVPDSEASTKLVESRGGASTDNRERDLKRGAAMPDWWTDVNSLQTWSPKRVQFHTQKPLALLRRIIEASSNPGHMVLDPFVGCATTPVAPEQLGRRWIGMDIWDQANETVLDRSRKEGLGRP